MNNLFKYLFITICLIFLMGCVGFKDYTPGGTGQGKQINLVIHADMDFSNQERAWLYAATQIWRSQTNSLADISIEYDVNFLEDEEALANQHDQDRVILAKTTSKSGFTKDMDKDGYMILAVVWPSGGIHQSEQVFMVMVVDRIASKDEFIGVAVHEMGHILGLQHVRDSWAIMYPNYEPRPNCLRQADIAEFCRVNDCGRVRMHPCGE